MAIYVYNTSTGVLVSTIPDNLTVAQAQANGQLASPAALTAAGLSAVDSQPAPGPGVTWSTTTFTATQGAVPVKPNNIPTYQFVMLFTPAEHAAIFASTDQKVQQFLTALQFTQQVNLNDTTFIGPGIAYLVSLGLLTQANATLILSGQPSQ